MKLKDEKITRAIVEEYMESFLESTDVDVCLAGAGPANLTAAKYLAEEGIQTVIFEENLSVGGGMWGGGMMFPRIVVQEEAKEILDEFGIEHREYDEGYFVANSIEGVCRLTTEAIEAGAEIFNCIRVEDVMVREGDKISGLVINWNPVKKTGMHVDPLSIKSKIVIDGTGHDAEICRLVEEKIPDADLEIPGERPMWADAGEQAVVNATKEIYPNLIVSGMAANNVAAKQRMGPIFGGMLLSGRKSAEIAMEKLD
ncbi:MAG: sulfide-dependent adenosine diphosphate thiazole synthase [Candidatus Hadarchaeia archaeon]